MSNLPDQDSNFIRYNKFNRIFNALFILILLAGLCLRFYQYLMGRSLWEDECHLALNFIKYGYKRLAKPLDFLQAAPIFWIYSVKTFAKIFGYGELALRATTFISSVLTLPLFYYIILELTKSKTAAIIGFLIFSVNSWLIYFSSELKPYGIDVSVYLLLVFLTISKNSYVEKNRQSLLAIAGSLSILFSNVAFIVLFCIVCYMLTNWYKDRKVNKGDIKVLIAWAGVFITNYFLFIFHHPATTDMKTIWAFTFCPINIFSSDFVIFINKTIEETFFTSLLHISKAYYFAYILFFVFIASISYILIRKKRNIFIFCCLPIIMNLVLSALKIYPFYFRFILYLLPSFIVLISLGAYLIADFIGKKIYFIAGIIFVIVCCTFFVQPSINAFPIWEREIKPSLDFVNKYNKKINLYITDPVNAYRYYYNLGYIKDSVYEEVPWDITLQDYYAMVADERSNYLLFYSLIYQWGYGDVIKDLKNKGLIVKNFEFKGYAVSEVKPLNKSDTNINSIYTYFDPKLTFDAEKVKVVAIWSGCVVSKPKLLQKGNYNITVISKGTPLGGVFPHNNIYINESKIGDFISNATFNPHTVYFEQKKDTTITIKIDMDNDAKTRDEDRNTFIRKIDILKVP